MRDWPVSFCPCFRHVAILQTGLTDPHEGWIRLNTVIFAPKTKEAVPIVFLRTPLWVSDIPRRTKIHMSAICQTGYLFVYQDIRGRYKSEGRLKCKRFMRDKMILSPSTKQPTPTTPLNGF